MNDSEIMELCLSLMRADTESDVLAILENVGHWENRSVWRFYGDRENNFSTIGNQQSRPDAALIEKLVNSVDARLMNECLVRGIDPEGSMAPQTIREAVACFFDEDVTPRGKSAGLISDWLDTKRTQVARGITLVATGATAKEGNPCFTITDCGEGQTPDRMPHTLLSLDQTNKLRIPFVQGKFNMGGTGVLQFCGRHNLQLIVSRRNPAISGRDSVRSSDGQWGFTIVRREDPEGARRSSFYCYLAPVGAEAMPSRGGVLRFSADRMPIFPEGRKPYSRDSEWGTLIKLYEYSVTGYKTHILRKDGILGRIDLLLPDIALPMRLHECRPGYRGHRGSFETTLTGLGVRLNDDKAENLEDGFPSSCPMSTAGEQMTATVYAFKKGRGEAYRKTEGIIFIVNGQTHGHLTTDFFRRKQVGLSYLADSILVTVDCTKLSGRAREDLFMNSRDRLRGGDLRTEIERSLEDILKHHQGLRDLKERRRREEIETSLEDSKPLEEILKSLIERYPSLSALFLLGKHASNPFKTIKAQAEEKSFHGGRFPTYFKFRGKDYGTELLRDCHVNMRCRITFETDAANDYFSRDIDPGEFSLHLASGNQLLPVENYSLNLQNGIATLSVRLPDNCRAGSILRFSAGVIDTARVEPFRNIFVVQVREPLKPEDGDGTRRKPPSKETGDDREIPSGIELPHPNKVYEADWQLHDPPFDRNTALRIRHAGSTDEDDDTDPSSKRDIYDFYINMDNVHLKAYLKHEVKNGQDERVTRTRFEIGLVLVGLALLNQSAGEEGAGSTEANNDREERREVNIEDHVESVTKALAPFVLPMIDSLGMLDSEDVSATDGVGEAT